MTRMVQATASTRSETSSEVRERVARRIAAPEGRTSAYSPGAGRLQGPRGQPSVRLGVVRLATGWGRGGWPGVALTPTLRLFCTSIWQLFAGAYADHQSARPPRPAYRGRKREGARAAR